MFPSDLISGILSGPGCACIDRPTAPKAIRPLPESLMTMRPAQPHLRARRHSNGANTMLDRHNLQARHAPAAGHATIPSIAVLARSWCWGRGTPATGHGGRSDSESLCGRCGMHKMRPSPCPSAGLRGAALLVAQHLMSASLHHCISMLQSAHRRNASAVRILAPWPRQTTTTLSAPIGDRIRCLPGDKILLRPLSRANAIPN